MAALRYAARKLLAGQLRQPIYRAAVGEEQRRLLPGIIHGGSPAYSRRFISIQPSEERLTFEEKLRISKRVAHVIFRIAKAVSVMVASGMIIKLSFNEFATRIILHDETASLPDMRQGLGDKPKVANTEYVLKSGSTLEAQQAEFESALAEFESVLNNTTPRVQKQREDHGSSSSFN